MSPLKRRVHGSVAAAVFFCGSIARAAPAGDFSEAKAANQVAHAAFMRGDIRAAIAAWEQAHAALPAVDEARNLRAQLSAQLAAAHRKLHEADPDAPEHLERAVGFYERALQELSPAAEDARVKLRAALSQVLTERDARRTATDTGAQPAASLKPEDTARAAAAPGQEVPLLDPSFDSTWMRPQPPRTRTREAQAPANRALRWVGVASLGVAAPLLVGMGVGLGVGERYDRQGANAIAMGESSQRLQDIRRRGEQANAASLACGVLGGIFAVTGIVSLILDGRHRETGRRASRLVRPVWGGVGMQF